MTLDETRPEWREGREAREARRTPLASAPAGCRCGQQLDCCARHHCPRCGRTLESR